MQAPRMLVASGSISGVDHERLGPNETMHEPVFAKITLTETDVPQSFATWVRGWGGECRLEVRLTARLLAENRIVVTVNGKFFEGEDEGTDQLEDEKTEAVAIPRSLPIPFGMTLFNSGIAGGGGDSAAISLTFMNTPVDE